jgi:putative FmdB family regulatory protein
MPIYEYECSQCGNKFEIRCSLKDSDVPVKCPECGTEHTKKLFSAFATNQSSSTCTPTGST